MVTFLLFVLALTPIIVVPGFWLFVFFKVKNAHEKNIVEHQKFHLGYTLISLQECARGLLKMNSWPIQIDQTMHWVNPESGERHTFQYLTNDKGFSMVYGFGRKESDQTIATPTASQVAPQ